MSGKVISSVSEINLDWLQEILDRHHHGIAGKLSGFSINDAASVTGHTATIKLSYEDNANTSAPPSLFLKFCQSNDHIINDSEYLYYQRDYVGLKAAPIPACFDAQYDRTNGSYHVLLEDLSQTHYCNREVKPTLDHALTVATELARLHAFKWGCALEDAGIETKPGTQITNFLAHAAKGLGPISKTIENDVPASWLTILQKIFTVHPHLMQERANNFVGQTLIHGDANPGNVLSPHDRAGKTYIIDRQPFQWSLRYWLGVYDLVYMTVPFWNEEDRRLLERPMLKQYHKSLLEFGVTNYSWQQCQADYRLCIPHGMYVAVDWRETENDVTGMRWLWERQLHRSMAAFVDWKCEELW